MSLVCSKRLLKQLKATLAQETYDEEEIVNMESLLDVLAKINKHAFSIKQKVSEEKKRLSAPPIIILENNYTAEQLNELVTIITFSEGLKEDEDEHTVSSAISFMKYYVSECRGNISFMRDNLLKFSDYKTYSPANIRGSHGALEIIKSNIFPSDWYEFVEEK